MSEASGSSNSSSSSSSSSKSDLNSSSTGQRKERVNTPPVHITAKVSPAALLSPPCDSNNNNNNNNSDDTGKLSDDLELPTPPPPSLPAIQQPSLSIWSSHPDPQVWSAPTDLNLFSQTTLLNRQPSNADSSYDSDDADADLLTKIVSDIVDSSESPQNDPQLCLQSESISALLLGTQTQTAVHNDVNRTLSDTLIQEYPEWNIPNFKELKLLESVTAATAAIGPDDFDAISLSADAEKPPVQSPKPMLTQEPIAAKAINHREIYDREKAQLYEEKLKFAKKLGYTEDMVAVALANVGYHVSKNDFLNELICIGNNETAKDREKGDLHFGACQPNDVTIRQSLDSTVTSVPKSPDPAPLYPQLRPIVIDGSNVAISHGNKEFSSRGIQIAIDWFRARGHTEITAFVPMWRKQPGQRCDVPTIDRDILLRLEAERVLTFTPSKNVSGRLISCHDDRYILNLATANQGIVVSNDHFRDLVAENPEYKKVVDERQLMYIFVGDNFMPPDDPLGRNGPKLDQFLRFPDPPTVNSNQPCPYSLKCTYGKKCKYFHPGRMQTTIADHLRDKQKLSGQNSLPLVNSKKALQPQNSLPVNLIASKTPATPKSKLCATHSIAYPFLASNAAFDASVQRFLQASAPLAKSMHPKLERQLTLNPFSNIIQVPSFSLGHLPSSSSSHSHTHLSPSSSTSTSRTPHGARPKQKLSQTKSNPVPTVDLISPFILSSSAASKSSQNLDK